MFDPMAAGQESMPTYVSRPSEWMGRHVKVWASAKQASGEMRVAGHAATHIRTIINELIAPERWISGQEAHPLVGQVSDAEVENAPVARDIITGKWQTNMSIGPKCGWHPDGYLTCY